LATANEIELFYEHLERVMIKTEFLDPKQPKMLMRRLRRLYNRAQMCQQELNIMRGILTACEKSMASDQV
jgi:tRNA/rRNA methyltransferase